jgi:hypothetical protein
VVPDQHAAFGIQRATQAKGAGVEDLGLEELVKRGRMERAIRWEEWAE